MGNNLLRLPGVFACFALASLLSGHVAAADIRLTGFGTLGYAESDQDFRYLRFIDKGGTFKADSLIGVQAEAEFSPQWSATLQAVASPSQGRDDGYEARVRWAFLSYRPTNDWLLRAGRLRPQTFLHTQNSEVGVTYDHARLPAELYTLTPNYDFDGAAFTKTWELGKAELSLDGYWGKSKLKFRFFQRDAAQPSFKAIELESHGLILSYSTDTLLLRGGAHKVDIEPGDGQPFVETFSPTPFPPPPFGPLPPAFGGGTLFLPSGSPTKIDSSVLTLGGDWHLGDWRFSGEYARRALTHTKIGPDSSAWYGTVAHRLGKWTPYLTHARLVSKAETRELWQTVNGTPVPGLAQVPPPFGPGLPANFHRILADSIVVFDQRSTMLGVSYAFTPTSKAKLEWMRTRVGLTSSLVDGDARDKSFNVLSISYSVSF